MRQQVKKQILKLTKQFLEVFIKMAKLKWKIKPELLEFMKEQQELKRMSVLPIPADFKCNSEFKIPKIFQINQGSCKAKTITVKDSGCDLNNLQINAYNTQSLDKLNSEIVATTFLGYPEYAILSQNGIIQDVITSYTQATKTWIKITSTDDNPESDKKIKAIMNRQDELKLRELFTKIIEHLIIFGTGRIYPEFKFDEIDNLSNIDDNAELELPLYTEKITKGSLNKFKIIEPTFCYPMNYNASNPLADDFYTPTIWSLLGKNVHTSRLIHFVLNDVSNLLKPTYQFGGIPMIQDCLSEIFGYTRVKNNIVGITSRYNLNIYTTNMTADLNDVGEFEVGQSLVDRVRLGNYLRDNYSVFLLDNNPENPEKWEQQTMSLTGFSEILNQNAKLVAMTTQVPEIVLFGSSGHSGGLADTANSEVRLWYDRLESFRTNRILGQLKQCIDYIQLDLFGEIDANLQVEFEPLWKPTAFELAEIQKKKQEVDSGYIADGVILPIEAREKLKNEQHSDYNSLLSDEEYYSMIDEQNEHELSDNEEQNKI